MSFFGFDTMLPRDRAAGKATATEPQNDLFGSLGGDDVDLDEKIRGLTAGAQEDVEIYEWGGEGYDGLGDMLDEAGDDLNSDTFGVSARDIGKDFNFGNDKPAQPQQPASKTNASMFASNFDDFLSLPSLSHQKQPHQQQPLQQQSLFHAAAAAPNAALQTPPPSAAPPTSARPALTMEEIEAEMRASRINQQQPAFAQQPPPQPPTAPAGRKAMTLEEIEAEMLASRQQQQLQQAQPQFPLPAQHQMPGGAGQPPFPPGGFPGLPPNMAAMMQGQPPVHHQPPPPPPPQAQPPSQTPSGPTRDVAGSDFPPLGTPAPVQPQSAQQPGGPFHGRPPPHMQQGPPPRGPAASVPHNPAAMQQSQAALQAQQADHFARMQALLRALPDPVQQKIVTLPPHLHFDVLQGISREFPLLLEPATGEDDQARANVEQAAIARLSVVEQMDQKRVAREAKIAAMARYNNLMTVSDKEFITRIQISQIITADPYADDFYAHIYFALRGRPGPNPGLMGAQPQSADVADAAQPPQPPKGPRGKQARMNATQKAMLRMQQQVERLVADRKQRIEKAAQGANPNLEGALGKVGLSVAGNPKQALQISKDSSGAASATSGSAADAVRQALEGASLGGRGTTEGAEGNTTPGGGSGKRAPLTRHETLRILEKLYDILLNLEQLRRSVDDAEAQQAEQEALTAALWKELRVLEPLEISDPHPFVSLLSTTKGKRFLPRALRHFSPEQTLTALTMIVASFDSLDVVRDAAVLDDVSALIPGGGAAPAAAERKREVELQTECFSNTIVPAMLALMSASPMKIVIGMLALFVERNDVVKVVRSRAGIAFLTILLSRAGTLRQAGNATSNGGGETATPDGASPTPEETAQWSSIFQLLFERLVTGSGGLSNLFPSSRAKLNMPFGVSYYLLHQGSASASGAGALLQSTLDELDEPVWNLYAALAVSSTMEQQSILVQELREKILENVLEARSKVDSLEGARKLRLVNIFLNALNLDASQITV